MNRLFSFLIIIISFKCLAFDFGINVHPDSFSDNTKIFSLMNNYNFHSYRVDYRWEEIEKVKGKFSPSQKNSEKFIHLSNMKGMSGIIILNGCSKFYTCHKPLTDIQLKAYLNYVKWVAMHFKGNAMTYEIWNEWTLSEANRKSAHSKLSAVTYMKLVSLSSMAIKKIDPNAKIIAGGINPTVDGEISWLNILLKLGIEKYINGISIHPYHYNDHFLYDPDNDLGILISLENDVKDNNFGRIIPLYITEFGFPVFDKTKFSQNQLSEYIKTYLGGVKKLNFVHGLWWYDLIDDGSNFNNREDNFGILFKNLKPKEFTQSIKNQ